LAQGEGDIEIRHSIVPEERDSNWSTLRQAAVDFAFDTPAPFWRLSGERDSWLPR
jgi:hypothetical protein